MRDGTRVHPFELTFAPFREARFPAIRDALGESADLREFVLAAPALELMRELRPDEGLGDTIDDFAALVHAAYLFWRDGEQTIALDDAATRRLCASAQVGDAPATLAAEVTSTRYIQIAPRTVWGQLADEAPFEPLDGWFRTAAGAGLRVVACFGVHEQRPGMSIAAVTGAFPMDVLRPDRRPLFAPTMPGGDAAHLYAVSVPGELLLLGWRSASGEEIARWR